MDKPHKPTDDELRENLKKVEAEIAHASEMLHGLQGVKAGLLYALGEAPLFSEPQKTEA